MQCPACYGRGCLHCDDGNIKLTSCARQQVMPEAWDILWWVNQYRDNKVLPEDGNGLSQTQSFMDALELIGRECSEWDNKLGISGR